MIPPPTYESFRLCWSSQLRPQALGSHAELFACGLCPNLKSHENKKSVEVCVLSAGTELGPLKKDASVTSLHPGARAWD